MADDYEDDDFDAGDAEASHCHPMAAGDIKKGGYIAMKGRPAKVVETSTSKTGKHGHAKMHIVAIDIFNGKKYEELHPTSHNVPVPDIERAEYSLVDVQDDGFVSLMLESGATREDLKLPEGEVGENLKQAFDDGKDLLVSTIKAMGIEQIMSFKEI
ncbi:Translation initiation factor 5A [Monocercomonoides exilis]|uniref:Translation initiation factor 5A n=1 Tax=Monocercomonoides exilis TaxID=2049356 RepID=UPI00355A688F|nr:Translation initiation factor 5A [Monocercomonoides exilis]KAH7829889.1 Translation initiation factor 5A [Monocercomonoides exilis]|eukprot:MONOS_1416.1-p1 / transcript=MONOS_1416.1 / gene=MONOS_1416 / organism=Monocercomonoides_exilis_PA203 / gene_product=Translation initiation factor 5A / transcript_product=Translation initiation factor 5A / location=Mono_scaffold00025:5150-5696(+) / protein_length=157 / sequence_SO=supercontig / SO=protein_coding / is_pseudo=false